MRLVLIESPLAGSVRRNMAWHRGGLAWGAKAELTACYVDLGVSGGMRLGIARAEKEGRPIEYRTIPDWKWPQ